MRHAALVAVAAAAPSALSPARRSPYPRGFVKYNVYCFFMCASGVFSAVIARIACPSGDLSFQNPSKGNKSGAAQEQSFRHLLGDTYRGHLDHWDSVGWLRGRLFRVFVVLGGRQCKIKQTRPVVRSGAPGLAAAAQHSAMLPHTGHSKVEYSSPKKFLVECPPLVVRVVARQELSTHNILSTRITPSHHLKKEFNQKL